MGRKCRLIQNDPATCARHFDHQVQLLFKFLKDDVEPLGPLVDYFYRVEFQQRGSPHIHCLLWIKDSPKVDNDMENVIEFIDKYISCSKPTVESNEEMSALFAIKYIDILTHVEKEESSSVVLVFQNLQWHTQCFGAITCRYG